MDDWTFTQLEAYEFNSFEEGLQEVINAESQGRRGWWANSDRMLAIQMQFGTHTQDWGARKKQLAEALKCSGRLIEQRVVCARKFEPQHRFPDLPQTLYRVLSRFDDHVAALEEAQVKGWSSRDAENALLGRDGKTQGAQLFRRQPADLQMEYDPEIDLTLFWAEWTQEGEPGFANPDDTFPVLVSAWDVPAGPREANADAEKEEAGDEGGMD